MKKRIFVILGALLAGAAGYYVIWGSDDTEYTYRTEAVSRGEIEKVVRATGTINPLQTVKVGSQVSGTVSRLFVDFNSVVTQGQIVAVIDSTFLSASVREAEANLQRSRAQLNESERSLNRTKELFAKDLVSQADLDAALTTYETSVAQMKQTEAALERARVNIRYAVIRSPIDGIVISRDVDVGQTVAASLSAPQLFAIANDLSRMQVEASVDEADIGQISAGQTATFTVDAYPEENFAGKVAQVRLSPITVQNVVTYTVIIDVPNRDQKLRPGMTATASIMIDRRDDVLRIPAVALRFQPPTEVLEAFNKERDADSSANDGTQAAEAGRGSGAQAGQAEPGERTTWTGRQDRNGMPDTARRSRNGDRPRRAGEAEPERSERRRDRSQDGPRGGPAQGGWEMGGMRRAVFASVWVMGEDGKLSRVQVRTGLTDQRYVELVGGKLQEGNNVVLGVNAGDRNNPAQRSTSPFQQQMGGPGGGGRRGP
ncbi:MAG TPA: efflux RND transporter periplasmic adaptor subunit [Bacteroidota bacterium]|nr:efflux RND transporter periplasmic adaptor subunit [Bacteroidota bacterium]